MTPLPVANRRMGPLLVRPVRCAAIVLVCALLAAPAAGRDHAQEQPSAPTEEDTAPIEQLRQLTAEFESYAYVPPPRTITDITEFLEQYSATGRDALSARQAEADMEPPAGADESTLGKFYVIPRSSDKDS